MTYLDCQATAPLAPEAFDAMLPWLRDQHGNPHSPHREGRRAKAVVELAREQVAALLPPGGRVVFTSGATEALNWAIKGSRGGIVTTTIEHAAVLDTVLATGARALATLPVDAEGIVAAEALPPACGLVAAMLVNNEIGTIQPIARLADLAHERGALLLCDAVQGYGRVPIPHEVDLVAISAHKIYGPKGIGALWVRDGVALEPLLHGGDQEGGRSGTLSPALCAGFGRAAALMTERADADSVHVARLWEMARHTLERIPSPSGVGWGGAGTRTLAPAALPRPDPPLKEREREQAGGWIVNGSVEHRYCGNLNIRRPGLDVARLMSDCRDIAFSAGSACASGSGRASHVLRAIGLSEAEARSSIRLGWGRYTTGAELSAALDRIIAAADAQG